MSCDDMGELHGVFIEDGEIVINKIGDCVGVTFGEVLGKYSEIDGTLTTNVLTQSSFRHLYNLVLKMSVKYFLIIIVITN